MPDELLPNESDAIQLTPDWSAHLESAASHAESAARKRAEQRSEADRWAKEHAEEQAQFLRDSFRGGEGIQDGTAKKGAEQPGDAVGV